MPETSPLYLKQVEIGPMENFVYFIGDKNTREVFVVDPAWQADTILKIAKEENLKMKAQALWTAKEMLTHIVIEFRKEHLSLFAKDTESLFHKISSDDYDHFSFNEEFLVPSLKTKGSETPIATSSLSCGTQDQLYFAMKLSLLKLLSCGRTLPLFLDDPFVNFDHERRLKVLEFLKTCAVEHQIFLFTYDPWYAQVLQNCNILKLNDLH